MLTDCPAIFFVQFLEIPMDLIEFIISVLAEVIYLPVTGFCTITSNRSRDVILGLSSERFKGWGRGSCPGCLGSRITSPLWSSLSVLFGFFCLYLSRDRGAAFNFVSVLSFLTVMLLCHYACQNSSPSLNFFLANYLNFLLNLKFLFNVS